MRDWFILYVNGVRHEVRGEDAFGSLSTFLRERLRLIGTKIVCSEGDCGSCTVLVGQATPPGQNSHITYKPICACIAYMGQLDCTHVITVEGLKYDGKLNPVQESMVRNQGSQCGFCTPGFVVSMCAVLDQKPRATEADLRRGLVGNLCRCTGYQSILDAGADVDLAALRPIESLFDTASIAADLRAHAAQTVEISSGGRVLCQPATLQEAIAFKAAHPDCLIWSGGTDLGVQMNKGGAVNQRKAILTLRALPELRHIELQAGALVAGACASITDLEAATNQHLPEYGKMLAWFGSPPIKNAGTVGGNIANGSPIADTMPGMYVLNAEVELTGQSGARRVNINSFFTGYKKTVMATDELITRIFLPLPAPGEVFKVYKVSKRKDLDISSFTAAIWMCKTGDIIDDIRIAYGGVAANIVRLTKTEALLRGQTMTEELFEEAAALAQSEIKPISDVRGSADFRLQLAGNILMKFFAEVSGGAIIAGMGSL